MHDPLHQFVISNIVNLSIFDINISFTNSSLFMLLAITLVITLFYVGINNATLKPNRIQFVAEFLFNFIQDTVKTTVGNEGMKFFPMIFTVFLFIYFGNLLGMIPGGFTFTSHIIVTFAMAITIFSIITIVGFITHGMSFFKRFLPPGIPLSMVPLIVPVEVISYVFRPISLSIRLFANMLAGHMILKIFSGFAVMMGLFGIFPVGINVVFIGFEFFVATLQAYIFTILSCAYLNDALHSH